LRKGWLDGFELKNKMNSVLVDGFYLDMDQIGATNCILV
jgi:hypothetical protein